MSRNVFLSPASKKYNDSPYKRLNETVVSGFEQAEVNQYTSIELTEPVRIWGFREGKKSFWEQMEKGDIILFYTGDEYEYAARVWDTEENKDLALHLWGILDDSLGGDLDDVEPWPYLVYLRNLRKLSLESDHLHDLLNYKASHISGTTRVKNSRKGKISQEYGSFAKLIVDHTDEKLY